MEATGTGQVARRRGNKHASLWPPLRGVSSEPSRRDKYRRSGCTYQTKWGSRTPEEVSLSVRTFLHDEGIPAASLIVSSGRGLYLKWLFETPIPQSALPRWNAVQCELVERLQGFGADPMAKDASRDAYVSPSSHFP